MPDAANDEYDVLWSGTLEREAAEGRRVPRDEPTMRHARAIIPAEQDLIRSYALRHAYAETCERFSISRRTLQTILDQAEQRKRGFYRRLP